MTEPRRFWSPDPSTTWMPVSEHEAVEAERDELAREIVHLVGTASSLRSARKVAQRFGELEAEVTRLRAIEQAAREVLSTGDDFLVGLWSVIRREAVRSDVEPELAHERARNALRAALAAQDEKGGGE